MTDAAGAHAAGARRTILYLHGFASSARARKARFLKTQFATRPDVDFHAPDLNPTPADFEYMTTTGLINRLRQYVLDHNLDRFSIIGSSFGGLVALHYVHRFGGIERMLLLAPVLFVWSEISPGDALERGETTGSDRVFHYAFERELPLRRDFQADGLRYREPLPPAAPMLLIHGKHDHTVPVQHSREYANSYPDQVRLIEVDAQHDLSGHLDLVWKYVRVFLLNAEQGGD